jgi:hypothetical protein
VSEIKMEHDAQVNLVLFRDRSHNYDAEYVSPLQEQTEQAEATLRIRVAGERGTFEIPVRNFYLFCTWTKQNTYFILLILITLCFQVSKADKRFFPFNFRGDECGDHHGMVSEIQVDNGSKFITFR